MAHSIFFSWQKDRPDGGEKQLIERALKDALTRIAADAMVEEAVREGLEIDKDTKGVGGTPPIIETIFSKIDRAAIFVPDLTFVCRRADGRLSPNPNVLIEYGWALKSRKHARLMPVMNVFHGDPATEGMPFDMAHLRHPIKFTLPDGAKNAEARTVRDRLSKDLEGAIRLMIANGVFAERTEAAAEFPAMVSVTGKSRFRAAGQPIGKTYPNFGRDSRNIFLSDGATMWVRLMPRLHPGRMWTTTELKKASQLGTHLLPMGAFSPQTIDLGHLHADDGFGVYVPVEREGPRTPAVLFVLHTGEFWSVNAFDSYVTAPDGKPIIPLLEQEFFGALDQYSQFLEHQLKIAPPYHCILGLEGIADRPVWLPGRYRVRNPVGSCVAESVIFDGLLQSGNKARETTRTFFVSVLEKCGIDATALD